MTKKEQQQLDQDLRCVQCGAEITYGLTCSNECHDARLADLDAQAYQSIVDEENERAEEEQGKKEKQFIEISVCRGCGEEFEHFEGQEVDYCSEHCNKPLYGSDDEDCDDDDECSDNRAEDNRAYNEMRYKEAKYYVGKYN